MIGRAIDGHLQRISELFPVVSLTGPRQAGKTTLLKAAFPDHLYCNLEDPSLRAFAMSDPLSFLRHGKQKMIIDEAQYVPELFSYIQVMADNNQQSGQFILSGSQNFLLMEKITQSLAGRVAILHLLPLSVAEVFASGWTRFSWEDLICRGLYPGPFSKNMHPKDFYPFYIQSYIERDVRQLVNVTDLERFRSFLTLCAGRVGQQVNLSAFGNELGIDSKTASRWLSVLETSFIIYRLPQFHMNFGKRLVKSPKLYFYDMGLVCYLLSIRTVEDLQNYYAKGSLFENFIISELKKNKLNAGERPSFFYFRDNTGNEIDLISEISNRLIAVEIKAGKTIHPDFFKSLKWIDKITGTLPISKYLIYGGKEEQERSGTFVRSWDKLPDLQG